MPNNPNFSTELAQQGRQLEEQQSLRLQLAEDPVYAHVATLATASAIGGIDWHRGSFRHPNQLNTTKASEINEATDTYADGLGLEQGLYLKGTLLFTSRHFAKERALDPLIDKALAIKYRGPGWGRSLQILKESSVTLEHPSAIYGRQSVKIGVTAIHADLFEHNVEIVPINEAPVSSSFNGVLALITDTDETGTEEDEWGNILLDIAEPKTRITTDPKRHFDFHEALGTPKAVMDLAKQNFGVITEALELPYVLSEE